ncbi:hypothetical protein SynRS9907_02159 [Synechococcus sp. RS9907]|nr:hypothetical protein SynRS9907_02159 [Synechococcus sp. RS9907]
MWRFKPESLLIVEGGLKFLSACCSISCFCGGLPAQRR